MKKIFLLLLAIPAALCAQTTINGSRIIKGSLDASGSTRSLPNRTGTESPAGRDTCATPGETYFQTDATPGQNLWVCTAAGTPGTWNQISGSGGATGESVATGTASPSGSCSTGAFYLRTDIQELYVCSGTNVWELASYASGNTESRPIGCVSGQLYMAIDTGDLWYCSVPGSLGSWQSVTPLTNVSLNGAPQGAFSTLNLVNAPGANWNLTPNGQTLNISPALPISQTTVVPSGNSVTFTRTTNIQEFILNLTSNVTSSGTSGFTAGDIYYFEICQNSTGGNTLAWPSSGFAQAPTVDPTANVCTKFHGTWDTSGTLQVAGVPTTSENPFLISQAHERGSTSTPATSFEALWPDSGRNTWTGINSAGNTHIMPRVKATNTTDQLNSSDLGDYTSIVRMSGAYAQGDCADIQSFTGGILTVGDAGAPCGTSGGGSVTSVFNQTGVVPNLSGDVSTSNSSVTTLATVNASPGSCGDAAHVCQVTTNAKGLVTGQTAIAITAGGANYQTVDANGAAMNQRPTLNLISGTNTTVSCVDNSGQTRTDCTITASAGAGGYGTIESNATPLTQRSTLNFSNEFTAADNSGAGRTDVFVNSIAAEKISGLQISALSDGSNVNTLNGTQTITGNKTFTGAVTASASPHTLPVQVASTAPSSCTVGEMYFNSGATAGQNLYLCTATNSWTAISSGSGSSTVTESVYLPLASGGTSSSSAVFGPGAVGDTGNSSSSVPGKLSGTGYNIPAFTFATDAGVQQNVYLTTMLPQNWLSSGPVNITLQVLKGSTTGTAAFNVATFCSSGTPLLSSPSWNTNSDLTVNVSSGQAYAPADLTWGNISMSECAAGNTLQIRVARDQTSGNGDNLGGSIYVLGLQIQWQHN